MKVWWTPTTVAGSADSGVTLASLTKQRFAGYIPSSSIHGVVSEKAAKADDASVPIHLWDDRVAYLMEWTPEQLAAKNHFVNFWRRKMHKKWCHKVIDSWLAWWKTNATAIKAAEPKYYLSLIHI